MDLNPDFFDMIAALQEEGADFLPWCSRWDGRPARIGVITGIDGVSFDEAWPNRLVLEVEGREGPCLGRGELLRNKQAAGREKDLVDLKALLGTTLPRDS